jgi:transcription elongation factor Elf1
MTRADEIPRIGECPRCGALEVHVILTESGEVICAVCGEDVSQAAS